MLLVRHEREMPLAREREKKNQYTVILAKQISQLEDHDDDVTLLPQIYSLIEEERRIHTFDNEI